MNSDGAGRAKGPAGLTAQGKKPICTCAQMLPYAVSPTDSSLQCTLSQEMHSWFWAWHPCSPIKHMLPVVSSCCLLTGPLHHLLWGQRWGGPGCGRDGGTVGGGSQVSEESGHQWPWYNNWLWSCLYHFCSVQFRKNYSTSISLLSLLIRKIGIIIISED